MAVAMQTTPRAIRSSEARLDEFQASLVRDGVQLRWPEELR